MARLFSLLVLLAATCASGFVAAPAGAVAVRSASVAPAAAAVSMTSADKKAKAAKRKIKSSRAAAKRFKVTATGKLLRHYAGKAHLLRKKRPQHLAKLRRVGSVNDAELDTYQKLLLVFPKYATPCAAILTTPVARKDIPCRAACSRPFYARHGRRG
jgi:large subunit ribosomal protein L35